MDSISNYMSVVLSQTRICQKFFLYFVWFDGLEKFRKDIRENAYDVKNDDARLNKLETKINMLKWTQSGGSNQAEPNKYAQELFYQDDHDQDYHDQDYYNHYKLPQFSQNHEQYKVTG